ncbi:uncharacterized protein LTR77_003089 [Saxophila tyrrhenica]|uniref:Uncharacterized protein n=1 Tax=Saxophila tyrrhenica TaxID=1690608 RepID=A0AAV9PJI9_9PEZI|nr:hypothetical protein LTR77_003089 [Saxophila tyrrhenica]
MKGFFVGLGVVVGIAVAGPVPAKRQYGGTDSSSVEVDAITAVATSSELPTYPGGYQPLPYGPPSGYTPSGYPRQGTGSSSMPMSAGPPASSETDAITNPAPSSGTGLPSFTATNGSFSRTGSSVYASGTGQIVTIETITVTLSPPTFSGSAYSPPYPAANSTSSSLGSAVTGSSSVSAGVPTYARSTGAYSSGVYSTGVYSSGASSGLQTVSSVITLSLTKTVGTTITPSGSSAGPVNSSNATISYPYTTCTEEMTMLTSSQATTINITLSTPSSGPSGTAPYSSGASQGSPVFSANSTMLYPTGSVSILPIPPIPIPTVPSAPYPYPYPYSLSLTTAPGSIPLTTAPGPVTSGFPTSSSNASMLTPGTGSSYSPSVVASTSTLVITLTETISSAAVSSTSPASSSTPSPVVISPTTSASSTSYSTTTETSTVITGTSTEVITISLSTISVGPSASGSEGSPINSSNSTTIPIPTPTLTTISTATVTSYAVYTPIPEASTPPASSEANPEQTSAPYDSATATNTPFPLPSSANRVPGSYGYGPPDYEKVEGARGWWSNWWSGN